MSGRARALLAGGLIAAALALAMAACGSGGTSSTTPTSTRASGGGHPGKGSPGGNLGPGKGPGAPPATRTSHPRSHQHNQGPPGSTMTSTYPGQIIGHGLAESGPVQPAELWPVTNGWRISDHRTLTAVYAGAAPERRSTGRLVIFRQNFVKVTQTSDRVDVPGSGPLRITGAPRGRSNQTEAQRSGTIEFRGANGITGTLDLTDDTVGTGDSP